MKSQNQHVHVLTIPLEGKQFEPDCRLAQTLLRRRADGPLLLRDAGGGRHTGSEGKLRPANGRPFLQAVFSDLEVLERIQEELRLWAPFMPVGLVRRERRKVRPSDLPCSCILTLVRWDEQSLLRSPRYGQVDTCPRHASLLPKPCAYQPLAPRVQKQLRDLVQGFTAPSPNPLPMLSDELPRLPMSSRGTSNATALMLAEMAREGRGFALYG